MSFKDKLKEKRLEANLTQVQLAEKVSVTPRTIQNYELGNRRPTKLDIVEKLAKVLNTTPEYLLGQNGLLVVAAHEQGGSKAARDIDELVSEVTGMFAGGRLSDEALDGAMKALNEAYWIAKEKNKKYTPKKYRKGTSEQKGYSLFGMSPSAGGETMNAENLSKVGSRLVKRCGTRDPFSIARQLGIEVLFCEDFGPLKGMYRVIKRSRFIFINENLSGQMQRIVCAHELGHDQLHRNLAKGSAIQEFMLYDMTTKPEYEANIVAAEILLDTDEILEYIYDYGYTSEQIARAMGTDINLVALKIAHLAESGYDLRRIEHRSDFLK